MESSLICTGTRSEGFSKLRVIQRWIAAVGTRRQNGIDLAELGFCEAKKNERSTR